MTLSAKILDKICENKLKMKALERENDLLRKALSFPKLLKFLESLVVSWKW